MSKCPLMKGETGNVWRDILKYKVSVFYRESWELSNKIQSNLSVRTPVYYGQFPMSRQNRHICSLQKTL